MFDYVIFFRIIKTQKDTTNQYIKQHANLVKKTQTTNTS